MVLASGGCSSKKSGESRTDRNQRKDAEETVAETTVAEATQKLAAESGFGQIILEHSVRGAIVRIGRGQQNHV